MEIKGGLQPGVSAVMTGKALGLICSCLGLLLFQPTGAVAHDLKELREAFGQEPIPPELMEITKEVDMTAGMKSLREQAHAKQHQLLKEHLRARTERICTESLANIPRLDQEIVDLRDRGQHEEEQAERKERDVTTGVIAETCTPSAMSKSGDLRKLLP